MISDNTLITVLDLWKKDKITLEEAKKLLNIEGEGIKWRQPQDLQPFEEQVPPYPLIPYWNGQHYILTNSKKSSLTCTNNGNEPDYVVSKS